MKNLHPLKNLKTSISLPRASYRRLQAARAILTRHGIHYSDQEVYRRLFKFFLKNWRGRGLKTNGLRRYNADGKSYEIHPLYINQVLHAALHQRSVHSGESISRMLDAAIRIYLPRLLESLLGQDNNSGYWGARYLRRRHRYPDFFINYTCRTRQNDERQLEYEQYTEIISKSDLSPMQIWNLMLSAA